ncbi:hypothetical protein [Candidatus Nanohalobium constans]|uniref:Yip1 domain-containing protein n=1 Tax=Candidatus Nanohalobium constans TaxID=2565781 RepID=A0A5Q0UG34_9ARCH|nr:hypothetical protein [Candidatus Nanohalobium constans]QGA80578.1 hypothetical protein LC1Nh_0689 [Candidatus Nanohalobium constans]
MVEKIIKIPEETIKNSEPGFSEGLKTSATSGLALGLLISLQLLYLDFISMIQIPILATTGVLIGLIGPAMSAVSVHPLIYYFGGRRYEETYKVFAFLTPHSLVGSVPGVNILGLPAVFFLQIKALSEVHQLEWSRAVLAAAVPGIGLTVIGALVFAGVRLYTPFL